jgi:UDP-N-acetylmuramoyl-L-alanyl-D-glutamate--2,6-diaminopimelate ligase
VRLADLVAELDVQGVAGDPAATDVTAVVHDSRAVGPGALFCCVVGSTVDGHDLAVAAVEAGAVALLCERHVDVAVPQVRVADVRRAMGHAAAALHGHPSRHLTMVGVTGTNGKTTTTHLLAAVLEADGRPTATIGNLNALPGGPPNTPEGPELQSRLAGLRDAGTQAVAMEVSSHALAQGRVAGTRFAVAVFTNLTPDHLDHHGTMEAYFAAKAALFEPALSDVAVVNTDDPHGRLLLDAAVIPTEGYSLADAADVVSDMAGTTCTWRGQRLRIPLPGSFNVANALAAATAAARLGVDVATIAHGLGAAGPVPGRFEVVAPGSEVGVVVDYAHTPDGLEQVLRAVRPLAGGGRVTVVFGCGGDRDRSKRPVMGAIAARLADAVVVTSDNPRSEDPLAIIAAVASGAEAVAGGAPVATTPDRRAAIAEALRAARPGDVVVVAGKGHETTQVLADREVPFDDRAVATELLVELGLVRDASAGGQDGPA